MLQNTQGEMFGIGENADVAIWIKITVAETGEGREMGPPSWEDTFEGDAVYWDLGKDEDTNYEINNNRLEITTLQQSGDLWRVSRAGTLGDFYLEAKFTTGQACSGKDAYGLIVRAPDQPNGIIDTGYILSFSCDGNFRIYRMDNGQYVGIQNWTPSPNILPGPNQTNLLGVQAIEDTIQLYANGTLTSEIVDGTYSTGLFGIMIRSDATPDFKIFINRVAYWE
jgi:hypothetical protein